MIRSEEETSFPDKSEQHSYYDKISLKLTHARLSKSKILSGTVFLCLAKVENVELLSQFLEYTTAHTKQLVAMLWKHLRLSCEVLAFYSNQLEYNGSQGANGAGSAGRIQLQGHGIHGKLVYNLCTDTIIHKAAYSCYKTMFLSRL